MSAPLAIELDTKKLNERILDLHSAFVGSGRAGDVSTIFEDESRLFLKQIIRLTAPKTLKQGEGAVSRDMNKLFTGVDDEFLNTIGSQHGVSGIDTWITTSGGKRKHLQWNRIDPTGAGMSRFHHDHQDRRGRARSVKKQGKEDQWPAAYVVSKGDLDSYKERIKSRVGRKKAAWGRAFMGLGGRLTRWVGRHVSGAKSIFMHQIDPAQPSIVMGSRAAGVLLDGPLVRSALRVRGSAIKKRIKLVLSGYSKDVARGIKLSRKAGKTPQSFQEAA